MYEILTGLTLDLYPFPSCRFSHSSIFCFRFSSSFWQSIIKQNTHEITTAIHTSALPISNINSSNWSDECLIKQQSRHSLHFDLLGKTYHISGNFCDDLIFVFCTISFKIANYQTTQKLYSLLFSKKKLFQSQKMTDENKKCYLFCCFRKFCDTQTPPRYMVNGYLFLLFGIHGCLGIMFLLKFHPRPLHGLQSSLGRVRIYGSMSTSAFILLTNTHIIYMYYSFGFIN